MPENSIKSNTCFIIDLYNKYRDADKARQVFRLNGRWWAILEVELEWGLPKLDRIDEDEYAVYHIYDTLEEAQLYVRKLRQLEGMKS